MTRGENLCIVSNQTCLETNPLQLTRSQIARAQCSRLANVIVYHFTIVWRQVQSGFKTSVESVVSLGQSWNPWSLCTLHGCSEETNEPNMQF